MTRGRLFGKPSFFRATAICKLTPMGALAIIGTSFSGYLFAENFLTRWIGRTVVVPPCGTLVALVGRQN